MKLRHVRICADGGHRKTGGYGSFAIYRRLYHDGPEQDWEGLQCLFTTWAECVSIKQIPLPDVTTSNEAEYFIQILALDYLYRLLGDDPEVASRYIVEIWSDSALVVNQVSGLWKVRAKNLEPLRDELLALLLVFGDWSTEWVPREIMMGKFGH